VLILLLGATGFIGAAVAARLAADGHEVVGVTRSVGPLARRVPAARWVEMDLRKATRAEAWAPHLAGIDAVVNCAGTLQDSLRDDTAAVHRAAPAALWEACEQAGVRRVIHFSAIGVDRGGISKFSATKLKGDWALTESKLEWVILRPSVVVGRQAYGGSALFRAAGIAAHGRRRAARHRPAGRRRRDGGAAARAGGCFAGRAGAVGAGAAQL
jgi:uncharacterized protein YbjT (DUF2867 family)